MLRLFKQYYPVRNVFFVLGEGLFIYISVLLACIILLSTETFEFERWLYLKIGLITILCQICLYYNDLYDLNITNTFSELSIRLLQALGIAAIILAGIYFFIPEVIIGKGIFVLSIGFVILLIVSWRFCYMIVLSLGMFNQNIILIGSNDLARKIMKEISYRKDCGYTTSAVILESNNDDEDVNKNKTKVLCKKEHNGLYQMTRDLGVKKIVVALKEKRGKFPTKELLNCRMEGIEVIEGNSFYEMLTGKLIVEQINPGWLIFSEGFHQSNLQRFFKRITDIILSFSMLIVFLPLIITIAILIKIDSKGPIFFCQERVGEKKKEFKIYKFRSMIVDAEKQSGPVWARDNDDRITRVGSFIRKWRLDEIPQLWNVLKGDMSFVGPRPERAFFVKKLESIIPYYGERFTVKPGVTGWAQVSYGYGSSVEDAVEKLNYDLFYIKNLSFFIDILVILRTIKTVLFGKGAR